MNLSQPIVWIYLLGGAGLTVVLVMSLVFEFIRNAIPPPIGYRGLDPETLLPLKAQDDKATAKLVMLVCCLCTGFWVCGAFGLLYFFSDMLPWWVNRIVNVFSFAFAGALVSYVFGTWLKEHDRKH